MTKQMKCLIFGLLIALISMGHSWATDFKVAVRAHNGLEIAIKTWQPTFDYLSQKLAPHTFTIVPIISLDEISVRTGNAEFDFVLTNPSSYVEIEKLHGAYALTTLNNKRANTAQSRFGSVIFTHGRNTDIVSLHDLENKSLMVVSKPAFGGWRVAWLEMLEQGFDPIEKLKELKFTKSRTQQEVVQAVLDGKVDAGVVRTDLLERLEAANKIDMRYLRIINNKDIREFPFFLSTKLYPEWAVAALNHISSAQAKEVADVLLSISKDNVAAKKGKYIGWIAPKDYSVVAGLMKRLEVGPYALKDVIK